jgi:hypothetical protein
MKGKLLNTGFKKPFILLLIVHSFLFFMNVNHANCQKSEIIGTILDSKTRETLVGANVIILKSGTGVSTDLNGDFQLMVEPGTYHLQISFISYKPKDLTNIVVKEGKTTDLGNILLESESQMLEEVVVKERKKTDTEISLISSIKTNNLAVTGITSQQISKTQDKDAAEAIRRVPGVTITQGRFIVVRGLEDRYSTVWLNNTAAPSSEADKRAFSFDVIPSAAIDRMMVYKTPAPELPADFAGATVQIFTKNIPDKTGLNIRYKLGYRVGTTFDDFMTYEGGKYDWLGFDDGKRSLPANFPSVEELGNMHNFNDIPENTPPVIAAKKIKIESLSESFNTIWTGEQTTAPLDNTVEFDYTGKFDAGKSSVGNITSVIYRNEYSFATVEKSEHHDVEAFYSDTDSIDYKPYYDYTDQESVNNTMLGVIHNWSLLSKQGTVYEFRNLFNQIGKKWFIQRNGKEPYFDPNARLDSQEIGFQARTIYSGQLGVNHNFDENKLLNVTAGFSYANKNEPDIRRVQSFLNTDSTSKYFNQYAVQIDAQASPTYLGRLYLETEENILNTAVNYSQKLFFGNFHPTIKTGAYVEFKDRQFNARNIAFTIGRNYSSSNDSIRYLRPVDLIFDPQYIDSTGIWVNENTSKTDSYQASGELIAGYVGIELPVANWLSIYTGARIERNRLEIFDFKDPISGDTVAVLDTINIFPSLNVMFHINDKSKIRVAYGKSTNRPEFREIAPFTFYDFYSRSSITGNTKLKNAYIHNLDLRYEFYPSLSEIITVGGFYKKFINPIEQRLVPGAGDDKRSVYSANLVEAESYGVEVESRVLISSLASFGGSKFPQSLFLVVNTSLLATEIVESTETSEEYIRDKKRPMQGQSPFIVNAGIYYDNADAGFMASILYNIIGDRILVVGDPLRPHVVEKSRNLIEINIARKIGKNLEIKVGVDDLLNEPVQLVQESKIKMKNQGEETFSEEIQVDRNFRSFLPGRKFSLGISLKI